MSKPKADDAGGGLSEATHLHKENTVVPDHNIVPLICDYIMQLIFVMQISLVPTSK